MAVAASDLRLFTLVNRIPVLCEDLDYWIRWFRDGDRTVDSTLIEEAGCAVTTMFLGMQLGGKELVLFETIVFDYVSGDPLNYQNWRVTLKAESATWAEAQATHNALVADRRAHANGGYTQQGTFKA